MPLRRVVLHIGMHKTGTTAFQSFCMDHWNTLQAAGFLYPDAGRPLFHAVRYGHHLLPWSINGRVTSAPYWPEKVSSAEVWTALNEELATSASHTAVLSSEEFETLNSDEVAVLAARLSQFDVTPVVWLRRLDDLVQAMYANDVVYNSQKSEFTEYVNTFPIPLNYSVLLQPWLDRFAQPPLIRFYTPETAAKGAIVDDIAQSIGLNLSDVAGGRRSPRVNDGRWRWYVVETCRQMNEREVPAELVVKFAHMMRAANAGAARYDIMAPSERAQLVSCGESSLEELKQAGMISDYPDFFRARPDDQTDAQWHSDRAENHEAITRIGCDIARVMAETIESEFAAAFGDGTTTGFVANDKRVVELRVELGRARNEISALRNSADAKDEALEQVRRDNIALRKSASWRVTKPLRQMYEVVTGVRQRIR
jgi:hypothetical protein